MASGFAVLLITAVAPIALFQGIKFAHGTAGKVARDVGGMALGLTPVGLLTRTLPMAALPIASKAHRHISGAVGSGLARFRKTR